MKFKKSNVTLLIDEKHIGIDIAFKRTICSCNSYGKDGAKNMKKKKLFSYMINYKHQNNITTI